MRKGLGIFFVGGVVFLLFMNTVSAGLLSWPSDFNDWIDDLFTFGDEKESEGDLKGFTARAINNLFDDCDDVESDYCDDLLWMHEYTYMSIDGYGDCSEDPPSDTWLNEDCNDENSCTLDGCSDVGGCSNVEIGACIHNDGCCPGAASCTSEDDNDCFCASDDDCDDSNSCTVDSCNENNDCEFNSVECSLTGDGCCPDECDGNNDVDCCIWVREFNECSCDVGKLSGEEPTGFFQTIFKFVAGIFSFGDSEVVETSDGDKLLSGCGNIYTYIPSILGCSPVAPQPADEIDPVDQCGCVKDGSGQDGANCSDANGGADNDCCSTCLECDDATLKCGSIIAGDRDTDALTDEDKCDEDGNGCEQDSCACDGDSTCVFKCTGTDTNGDDQDDDCVAIDPTRPYCGEGIGQDDICVECVNTDNCPQRQCETSVCTSGECVYTPISEGSEDNPPIEGASNPNSYCYDGYGCSALTTCVCDGMTNCINLCSSDTTCQSWDPTKPYCIEGVCRECKYKQDLNCPDGPCTDGVCNDDYECELEMEPSGERDYTCPDDQKFCDGEGNCILCVPERDEGDDEDIGCPYSEPYCGTPPDGGDLDCFSCLYRDGNQLGCDDDWENDYCWFIGDDSHCTNCGIVDEASIGCSEDPKRQNCWVDEPGKRSNCVECKDAGDCTEPDEPQCYTNEERLIGECIACKIIGNEIFGCSADSENPFCKVGSSIESECVECGYLEDEEQVGCTSDPQNPRCYNDKCHKCSKDDDCAGSPETPYCYGFSHDAGCFECRPDENDDRGFLGCENTPDTPKCLEDNLEDYYYCGCEDRFDCEDNPNGKYRCHQGIDECVECTEDDECGSDEPVCDLTTYTCGPCTHDDDCLGENEGNRACDVDSGACVECDYDDHCNEYYPACNEEEHECVKCTTNSHCENDDDDEKNVCDVDGVGDYTENKCVECLERADCIAIDPNFPKCHETECYECETDTDCADNPGKPYCDEEEFVCKPCRTDPDCTDPALPYCNLVEGSFYEYQCVECKQEKEESKAIEGEGDGNLFSVIGSFFGAITNLFTGNDDKGGGIDPGDPPTGDLGCFDPLLPYCSDDGMCDECSENSHCSDNPVNKYCLKSGEVINPATSSPPAYEYVHAACVKCDIETDDGCDSESINPVCARLVPTDLDAAECVQCTNDYYDSESYTGPTGCEGTNFPKCIVNWDDLTQNECVEVECEADQFCDGVFGSSTSHCDEFNGIDLITEEIFYTCPDGFCRQTGGNTATKNCWIEEGLTCGIGENGIAQCLYEGNQE
jgi:hypothetical protein